MPGGLQHVDELDQMIQRRINRNPKIFGIVMTMVDGRSKLSTYVRSGQQENAEQVVQHHRPTTGCRGSVERAPTVILNKPTNSGAGAGVGVLDPTKEVHQRVQKCGEFGVVEESRLRRERSIRQRGAPISVPKRPLQPRCPSHGLSMGRRRRATGCVHDSRRNDLGEREL